MIDLAHIECYHSRIHLRGAKHFVIKNCYLESGMESPGNRESGTGFIELPPPLPSPPGCILWMMFHSVRAKLSETSIVVSACTVLAESYRKNSTSRTIRKYCQDWRL